MSALLISRDSMARARLADRILPMSMSRRFPHPRSAWRCLLGLAMLAFVLRALVPAGFMPGMVAGHSGPLVLMLCNAAGEETSMALDFRDLVGDKDHGAGDERMSSQDCPYGMVAAQAMLPTADMVLQVASVTVSTLPVAFYFGPWPISAQGPPLGSRAPPTHLG
jgi:hypothetical protein